MNKPEPNKANSILILVANILLFSIIAALVAAYALDYRNKLHNQNVSDVSNINQSAANISATFFDSQQKRLRDIAQYVTAEGLDVGETLDYVSSSRSDQTSVTELVGADGKGFLAESGIGNGEYPGLNYGSGYAEMLRIFKASASAEAYGASNAVSLSPEFSDQATACRSFALYTYVRLADENGEMQPYTIMIVLKTADFQNIINLDGGYSEIGTVLIDYNGNYIIGNQFFKSANFYQYIYVFNSLTLDQKNKIVEEVRSNGKGSLVYNDSKDRECLFAYTQIPESDWYSVTCVPISCFHNNNFDIYFTGAIVAVLVVLMGVDILWLRSVNIKLRKSVEKEREASRAKMDFLSRMSHDIRTPLNGIIGMTTLSLDEKNQSVIDDNLRNIESSSKFLLGLVNDILDMNKVESGKMKLSPTPYKYGEFMGYIRAVIGPLCENKNINFVIEASDDDLTICVDKLRMNQIFFNLLSNSVKFTPKGGKIELITSHKLIDNDMVSLDFIVRDNGIGMSREFQEHMFESFSQEEHVAAVQPQIGTGLGLAIVDNLVRLMNGTISVESETGKGTTFHVCLTAPLTKAETDNSIACADDSVLNGKRVLLCEDHPLNATIAVRLLAKKGVIAEHAVNGQIGVDMFAASAPGYYDAVLMDIRMPVMDGLMASKALRRLDRADAKSVPVIAMTANAFAEDIEKSKNAGMNAHLAKPIDPPELFRTLAALINSRGNH